LFFGKKKESNFKRYPLIFLAINKRWKLFVAKKSLLN
jgi:hypothetical protein